ncbi:hypothetical protein pEaSNUABM5_00285 [Erwinia phage pEa_SNUABM_5]|uniref:Uncharacterized protein n=1 Tax=Erwinia phage pEa_SNUABM_5 TaxID=2797313 RepID=A0A7T8EPR7_9CAUD|nr:hypothetical protein MPK73_gp285 [Erwinia phage pEa_SNUABM_5]QQO90427.1 hypothetical protein pEaSNUABM5_00285 [Erwinia phage pEa_SNUABM_5]
MKLLHRIKTRLLGQALDANPHAKKVMACLIKVGPDVEAAVQQHLNVKRPLYLVSRSKLHRLIECAGIKLNGGEQYAIAFLMLGKKIGEPSCINLTTADLFAPKWLV